VFVPTASAAFEATQGFARSEGMSVFCNKGSVYRTAQLTGEEE
jgi:hypothetical protein